MMAIPVSLAHDAPFSYVGGDVSLDFVNTVNWTPDGREWSRDRFSGFDRLLEWTRGASIVNAAQLRRLTQLAGQHPKRAASAFELAMDARRTLYNLFAALAAGRADTAALNQFNDLFAEIAPRARLVRGSGGRFSRGWEGLGESLESITWPIVWSASELASSTDIERLRMCAGEECGWLYVDRSRNGLRRWCEMSVCGTTEKNRRRSRA